MEIITGVLLGFSTLLFIGPVFFYLLKSSMEYGVKAGVLVAIGIILGDIICVLLAIHGFGDYFELPQVQKWFAGIGGLLLIGFGLRYILKSEVNYLKKRTTYSPSNAKFLLNGFLINFINPFVFAVWFGFYAIVKSKFQNEFSVIISLISALVVIFITDILKAVFANKISNHIKPERLTIVYKIFGLIMLIFGIRLIFVFFSL